MGKEGEQDSHKTSATLSPGSSGPAAKGDCKSEVTVLKSESPSGSPTAQEGSENNHATACKSPATSTDEATAPTPKSTSPADCEERFRHRKTRQHVRTAKKNHRSDIPWTDWGKYGTHMTSICLESFNIKQNIPRVHQKDLTLADFVRDFEIPSRPCLLLGCMDTWPAMRNWTTENLRRVYRHARFKVGEDDDGRKIKMKMKHFIDYLNHQKDDSPLYLFESTIDEKADTCALLQDWKVPDFFPVDLHLLVGEEKRPPYRWFCIGPERSGTSVHVDPLGTAAWNAVVSGHKRWALFPPSTPKRIVKGRHLMLKGEDDEPIFWFHNILPRIKENYPQVQVLEGPGEVIFVPPGWWHAVLNLDDAIACTQNYLSFAFIDKGWRCMRRGRRRLAVKWLRRLEAVFGAGSPVVKHIRSLNSIEGWEIRDGKFCRVRTSAGYCSSTNSSSSSSSSSSDSSDDEDDMQEIQAAVKRLEKNVPEDAWDVYLSTLKLDPSVPQSPQKCGETQERSPSPVEQFHCSLEAMIKNGVERVVSPKCGSATCEIHAEETGCGKRTTPGRSPEDAPEGKKKKFSS